MKAIDIQDDTLTLLLSSAMNRYLGESEQARKIRKCAKVISQRTKDKPLKNACKRLRNEKNDCLVIKAIDNAEHSYLMEY